jgi:hypothetical protein
VEEAGKNHRPWASNLVIGLYELLGNPTTNSLSHPGPVIKEFSKSNTYISAIFQSYSGDQFYWELLTLPEHLGSHRRVRVMVFNATFKIF